MGPPHEDLEETASIPTRITQLPAIPLSSYNQPAACKGAPLTDWVAKRALELVYTAWDLRLLAEDRGNSGPPFRWDDGPLYDGHMDLLCFVSERLRLIRYLYENTVPRFDEIKRKIDENEEPYIDCPRRDKTAAVWPAPPSAVLAGGCGGRHPR